MANSYNEAHISDESDNSVVIPEQGAIIHPWRRHILTLFFFILFFGAFFSPVTFSGRMLGAGDTQIYHFPHYQIRKFWNPDLMTGFPDLADPQEMNWYPPMRLFSAIPGAWNWFVIFAYVIAAWFTYLYVFRLTADHFAGLIAGIIYGCGGLMIAHLFHTAIIHAAAWIPGMLWTAEELIREARVRWILLGALMEGHCMLAGHPQIAFYGLALTGAYLLVGIIRVQGGRRRLIEFAIAMMVLAVMLCALQILPAKELLDISERHHLTFAEFSSYSLTLQEVFLFLFPSLFGGGGAFYLDGVGFFAPWNTAEVIGYVGFSALVLAGIAVCTWGRRWRITFWSAAAVFAFLASFGGNTPFGHLVYHLPGFGLFRAQGRFVGVFDLSIAVLAGCGVSVLRSRPKQFKHALVILGSLLLMVVTALVIIPAFGSIGKAEATAAGIAGYSMSIGANRWIRLPVFDALIMSAILMFLWARRMDRIAQAVLVVGMVCDLGLFGWFDAWRYASSSFLELKPPPVATSFAHLLEGSKGRWLTLRGGSTGTWNIPPDLSALWHVPSIGKYGPLLPLRYGDLLEMDQAGSMVAQWWNPSDRALDIVGARFLLVSPMDVGRTVLFHKLQFPADDLQIVLGDSCGATASEQRLLLPQTIQASAIGVLSAMGCSTDLPQGSSVLSVQVHGTGEKIQKVEMRAGVDTAEWAAVCADVAPIMRHRSAEVVATFPAARPGGLCQGQQYGSIIKLPQGSMPVQSMDFQWLAHTGNIHIISVVFLDHDKISGGVQNVNVAIGDSARWRRVQSGEGGSTIIENRRAMPRTWIAPEAVYLNPEQIKHAIMTSRLPDGRAYDPHAMALVEEPVQLHASPDPRAEAKIVNERDTSVDIETSSRQPGFLVLADFNFPGWRVSLNGVPARIIPTNYVQRGLPLPAGNNRVHFEFRPTSFYIGLGITGIGILCAALLAFWADRRGIL